MHNITTKSEFERRQKEKREEEIRKQEHKFQWKLTIFSVVAGGLSGLITSIIFWLISN